MKRFTIFLFMLLSNCSQSSELPPSRVRLNLYTEPTSLDPRLSNDPSSMTVALMLYEGLTRDHNGEPELAIAKAIKRSRDGLTYTIHMRPSKWSDGTPLTAADFERSWKEVCDPTFPADRSYFLFSLKNGQAAKEGKVPTSDVAVKALDELTLRIKLEHPVEAFLSFLSSPIYFPVAEGKSNGPFTLQKWQHGALLRVGKNLDFWDADSVQLDLIEMAFVESETTELYMFEQGTLDWAGAPLSVIPFDVVPRIQGKETFRSTPIAGTYWYKFNTKALPFNNKKVRQAFSHAVNRDQIVKHLCKGIHAPADGFIPRQIWDVGKRCKFQSDAASQLLEEGLEELGISREQLGTIELSFNSNEDHLCVAQEIQQQWHKALGVNVKLQPKEWKAHLNALQHHDYQIGRSAWIAQYDDPIDMLSPFKFRNDPDYGGANDTNWENREYIALLDKAERALKREERNAFLSQAEALLLDEMPLMPLYFLSFNSLCNTDLEGVVLTNRGKLDFRWAFFDRRKFGDR